MEWLGWCIFFLIVAAACFVVGGYLAALIWTAAEKKEQKKVKFFGPSVLLLLAGFILSGLSLWWVYKNSVGRAATPGYLNKSTFYRALGAQESLIGENFVATQDAINQAFFTKSKIKPARGAFLKVVGNDFEIVEPNK